MRLDEHVRYMLLIYSSAESWEALSRDERRAIGNGHAELVRQLRESGEYVSGGGLDDESLTATVKVRDGEIEATDGPFAESKEHLAGYYVVDVPDRDAAVAIAARMPDAKYVAVEVRPLSTQM
jgi:hypothetical protein